MKTELLDGENIIKEGPANITRGAEAVGGKLFLTNMRLIFESHALNIQAGNTIISLSDISGAGKAWTKFLGFLPLAPNAIEIKTKEGGLFSFTLWGREGWMKSIQQMTRTI